MLFDAHVMLRLRLGPGPKAKVARPGSEGFFKTRSRASQKVKPFRTHYKHRTLPYHSMPKELTTGQGSTVLEGSDLIFRFITPINEHSGSSSTSNIFPRKRSASLL